MGKFVASPDVLYTKGQEILSQSESFGENVTKVFTAVNQMVNSSYVSPEAAAIGRNIESYRDDLNRMTQMIASYGIYCQNASKKVVANQENIISGIH